MTAITSPGPQIPPQPPAAAPGLSLPPGPRLPRVLQTAGFLLGGARFLEACRRR